MVLLSPKLSTRLRDGEDDARVARGQDVLDAGVEFRLVPGLEPRLMVVRQMFNYT
jgi:hypothetical protein